ncbi:hypothetical protein WA588_002034, partial [Blastocystis sp. NMH]
MLVWIAIVALFFSVAAAKGENREQWSPKQIDDYYQRLYDNCEERSCKDLNRYENLNCIHTCISETCYDLVYHNEPLEPGEVDLVREDQFITCVKNGIVQGMIE